jgi:hypothetical protein
MNQNLVNIDSSTYSGNLFTSTVDPRSVNPNSLPLPATSNVEAANASKFIMNGGKKYGKKNLKKNDKKSKIYRKKINKISRMYKMKGSRKNVSRRVRQIKSRVRSRFVSRTKGSRAKHMRRHRTKRQRGGTNNMPFSNSYSTGGVLSPSLSALANPPIFTKLDNTNCPSSYNHFK